MEVKQGKYKDENGVVKECVFIGAEKAIYDENGKRLDIKLQEILDNPPKVDKVLSGFIVGTEDFTNNIATIEHEYFTDHSVVDVYFDETSIPIARKCNIIVNSENGYLEIKVGKMPTASLTLETIRIMDKDVLATLDGSLLLDGSTTLEGYSHKPIIQNPRN